jgi:peroxiredoxin
MTSPRVIATLRFAGLAFLSMMAIGFGIRFGERHANHSGTSIVPGAASTPGAMRVPVGEASPPSASDFDDPTPHDVPIPERLPAFSLHDSRGRITPIDTWAGKSLILNFWATWCAPCRRELPLLKTLNGEWAGRNVQVVGIAVDYPEKVAAFADEMKIPYPLLIGDQDALDVAARLGVASPVFPFTVFTDKRGEVVALYVGELHQAQADLILGVVQNLNEDRLKLPEARRNIAQGLQALAPNQDTLAPKRAG